MELIEKTLGDKDATNHVYSKLQSISQILCWQVEKWPYAVKLVKLSKNKDKDN